MTWLFVYVLAVSLYDLRTRFIPNWYTVPMIIAGMIVHFPGHPDLWFAGFILLLAWSRNYMGAGDVKLWLAVLWALPAEGSLQALLLMAISFFVTGLAQLIFRMSRKQQLTHQLTPGAWRTIPFILLSWYAH